MSGRLQQHETDRGDETDEGDSVIKEMTGRNDKMPKMPRRVPMEQNLLPEPAPTFPAATTRVASPYPPGSRQLWNSAEIKVIRVLHCSEP